MTSDTLEVQGDESDRRAMREIFSRTGHQTLNALLIVSGGATLSFMTFLGAAVQQPNLVKGTGSAATLDFARSLRFFFLSVLCAVLAHGTTYASHAAFAASFPQPGKTHRAFTVLGRLMMWITVIVCAISVGMLWRGGFAAIDGFRSVADVLTSQPRPAT